MTGFKLLFVTASILGSCLLVAFLPNSQMIESTRLKINKDVVLKPSSPLSEMAIVPEKKKKRFIEDFAPIMDIEEPEPIFLIEDIEEPIESSIVEDIEEFLIISPASFNRQGFKYSTLVTNKEARKRTRELKKAERLAKREAKQTQRLAKKERKKAKILAKREIRKAAKLAQAKMRRIGSKKRKEEPMSNFVK